MAEARFYVGVHGVIANRGRMLVLRRAATMRYAPGAWDLPGGHLAIGESVEQCLLREVREETGLDVAIEAPLGFHNMVSEPYVQAIYACRLSVYQSVRLKPDEHIESSWVTPAELSAIEPELIPYLAGILSRGMLSHVK
ncbi:MAG TPA: NUDIX domain-containing protein [Candidatus Binataceae bacterium]|nr:NUDIX domain-containing protein [Candidatus Binataceae bacterium]